MTPPTTDELLRLARKAWPGLADVIWDMATVTRLALYVDSQHAKTEQAMHAALLVLAGEGRVCLCKDKGCNDVEDDVLQKLAAAVAECAAAWEPEARLIGNVRADEVLLLATSVAALLAERDRLRALCTEAAEEIRLVSPMTAREFAAQLASPQENP